MANNRVLSSILLLCLASFVIGKNQKNVNGWDSLTITDGIKTACDKRLGCFRAPVTPTIIQGAPKDQFSVLPFAPSIMKARSFLYTSTQRHVHGHSFASLSEGSHIHLNLSQRLVILTHGFTDNYKKKELVQIRNSLLDYTNGDVGAVIMVDWKKGSFSGVNITNYNAAYGQAVANTQVVGREIAYLINYLVSKIGLSPKKIYLLGHSLGAQSSGIAGQRAIEKYGVKVGRITGLDPAGPLFLGYPVFLQAGQADFVDIVHSSAFNSWADIPKNYLGYPKATGDVDFFPNGGVLQPQCPLREDPKKASCVHQAALAFYEESIVSCYYRAYPAVNWGTFVNHLKNGKLGVADSRMGYYADRSKARGSRYLKTNGKKPFC